MRSSVILFIFIILVVYLTNLFFNKISFEMFELKKINKIKLFNNKYISENFITNKISLKEGQSFWLFNPIQLRKDLSNINEIENFKYNLEWNGTLKIYIKEKKPFMRWIVDGHIGFIDEEGNYLNIKNSDKEIIQLFGKNANKNISLIRNILQKERTVFPDVRKIYFKEKIGWLISFDSQKCVYLPIKKLDNLVNIFQNIKDSELYENYSFFDLRIIGRIYLSKNKC